MPIFNLISAESEVMIRPATRKIFSEFKIHD